MTSTESATTRTPEALPHDAGLVGDWVLDGSKSTVSLKTRHTWGLLPVSGVFHELRGQGTISATGSVRGTLTVAATSIDTANKKRDEHLRSADFFDVSTYPDITFVLDGAEAKSGGITITGALTVRSTTRPITFQGNLSVSGDDEVWLDAEIPMNRADFDLTWNRIGMASMKSTMIVHAVFAR